MFPTGRMHPRGPAIPEGTGPLGDACLYSVCLGWDLRELDDLVTGKVSGRNGALTAVTNEGFQRRHIVHRG